jgi:thymidylate synthase (FAD)
MTEIIFRSDVTVELVNSMAKDSDVAMAARVSTVSGNHEKIVDLEKDAGLINYLMRDRHGSPFEHNAFTFYIEAPIFVFREFMRHRIASYNEESGRYKELAPVFYIPGPDRKLKQIGKAGAYVFEDGSYDQKVLVPAELKRVNKEAYSAYERMLDKGIAREVARAALPVNIYSSMYVTMNARSLMNFLSLRTQREGTHFPSFPQREIEMVAEKMEEFFAEKMPITYDTFNKNGRVAP